MDQGNPPLNSSTLHVNITVVDENDNNPKFEQAMYSVEVWENETIGGHVVQVKATERDSATGSHIGYSISAGDPQGQFKIFHTSVRRFLTFSSFPAAVDKNLRQSYFRFEARFPPVSRVRAGAPFPGTWACFVLIGLFTLLPFLSL